MVGNRGGEGQSADGSSGTGDLIDSRQVARAFDGQVRVRGGWMKIGKV